MMVIGKCRAEPSAVNLFMAYGLLLFSRRLGCGFTLSPPSRAQHGAVAHEDEVDGREEDADAGEEDVRPPCANRLDDQVDYGDAACTERASNKVVL